MPSSVAFFSLPLAAHLVASNTASLSVLLVPYAPPAPMGYPFRPNLPIELRIPNQLSQSLVSDLRFFGQHNLCPPGFSVKAEAAAAR